jgi:hypothetical protein
VRRGSRGGGTRVGVEERGVLLVDRDGVGDLALEPNLRG